MSYFTVYTTFPNLAEAQKIAQHLLEQRLVACANIMAPHQSLYWWQGKIETAQEVAVIFKTRADLFENVAAAIKSLHSYDVPCIVALPIAAGHEPFLEWIEAETTS